MERLKLKNNIITTYQLQ